MPQCGSITYELVKKKVKNITIHIQKDGTVMVTMPFGGSIRQVHGFVESHMDWIEKKLSAQREKRYIHVDEQIWTAEKEQDLFDMTARIFPRFQMYQIPYPQLRFRKMVGRYGSCQTIKKIVTLNKILAELPDECAEYVIAHELAHLVEANHGSGFYRVLESVMPDYKQREKRLMQYALCH